MTILDEAGTRSKPSSISALLNYSSSCRGVQFFLNKPKPRPKLKCTVGARWETRTNAQKIPQTRPATTILFENQRQFKGWHHTCIASKSLESLTAVLLHIQLEMHIQHTAPQPTRLPCCQPEHVPCHPPGESLWHQHMGTFQLAGFGPRQTALKQPGELLTCLFLTHFSTQVRLCQTPFPKVHFWRERTDMRLD